MSAIGVDIDLTYVRSDYGWWEYANKVTGMNLSLSDFKNPSYNIGEYYGMDLSEYWRQKNLYDDMQPIPGVVDVLTKLQLYGHEIVFVSKLKGDHHKSKVEFVKRTFPSFDGFIGTHEKKYARVDVLIDDRLENLYQMPKNVGKVLYLTEYEQNIKPSYCNHSVIAEWCEGSVKIILDSMNY